uniref:Uncharacterized protein n=1 Tax=Anguilla anguilla TaxID=7936 RepID=A0A0E9RVR1_ANGAN
MNSLPDVTDGTGRVMRSL